MPELICAADDRPLSWEEARLIMAAVWERLRRETTEEARNA